MHNAGTVEATGYYAHSYAIVVGGAGTVTGAIYGAIFIGLVPDYASQISKAVPWALYGCCLIACVFLMPDGIHGVVSKLTTKLLPMPRVTPVETVES